ncbi:MAG: hypothetical protein Athens101410_333 [Parcubacteria group bacterium Athens1014_10]|nr:MAG: hypothetical protein Athens101410_333 [Parcubacteria group bacterium Athens1014_10]TSD05149.1 MAG: hypothetical protein Athens071412_451 [Parcubacteria group bacterium Athens0714_12]
MGKIILSLKIQEDVFIIKADSIASMLPAMKNLAETLRKKKFTEILEKELDKMELCFARDRTGLQSW